MSISIAKIKHVQSLRVKKFRQKYNQFIVEGDKAVYELINSGWEIDEIFYTEAFKEKNELQKYKHSEVKAAEMERLSEHQSAPNVLAIVYQQQKAVNEQLLKTGFSLLIDGIQDPGNLGTLIRIADWYAVDQVICSTDTVDLYNHKTIAASMGSFLRVPVIYTSLAEILGRNAAPAYACVMNGENLHEVKPTLPAMVVIGNEGAGIRKELLESPARMISIPKFGSAESLNAAVAAAVVLDRFRSA